MRQLYFSFAFLLFSFGTTFAQANFTIDGLYCVDAELTFKGPEADSWAWDFGDGNTSIEHNPIHSYQDSGIYIVNLSITIGGVNSSAIPRSIRIYRNPIPYFWADSISVSYSSYTRLFIDTSIFYNATDKFYWDFGDGNSFTSDTTLFQYKYGASGTYTVWHKVTDAKKCTDSISEIITIADVFTVPNVFSPNNDLINDQFIVTSNGVTQFTIDIYSRWGNRVFSRSGTEQIVWDGRLPNGTLVKPGTYFYVITPQNGSVTYEPETGFVTVFY